MDFSTGGQQGPNDRRMLPHTGPEQGTGSVPCRLVRIGATRQTENINELELNESIEEVWQSSSSTLSLLTIEHPPRSGGSLIGQEKASLDASGRL